MRALGRLAPLACLVVSVTTENTIHRRSHPGESPPGESAGEDGPKRLLENVIVSDYEEEEQEQEQATSIISLPTIQQSAENRSRAYFIVLAGANVGEMYKLEQGEVVLGRGREVDVRIVDEGISRRHCVVRQVPTGDVMIEDINSSNGTFANGRRIRTHLLKDGDKIQIGSTTILKFTYTDDLDESFQRQMLEAALRDGLTKAFNRKYFHDRLESEYAYSIRHKSPLTLFDDGTSTTSRASTTTTATWPETTS